jgi:hypothetical protein
MARRRVTLGNLPLAKDAARGILRRVPSDTARCPECGAPLAIDVDVDAFHPTTGARRMVPRVALCGCCEFTHEF